MKTMQLSLLAAAVLASGVHAQPRQDSEFDRTTRERASQRTRTGDPADQTAVPLSAPSDEERAASRIEAEEKDKRKTKRSLWDRITGRNKHLDAERAKENEGTGRPVDADGGRADDPNARP